MPKCHDISAWRLATRSELVDFVSLRKTLPKRRASHLIVRTHLHQVDMYTYLRARFGKPNGFQNFIRRDDSDNLIHWDFNLKVHGIDVYIQGRMRDIDFMIFEELSDEEWRQLIDILKGDFARIGPQKSAILKSLEKYVVFPNKFLNLSDICADLHAEITDTPKPNFTTPKITTKKSTKQYTDHVTALSDRSKKLHANCLKLALLTPVLAETFINFVILILCKSEIRENKAKFRAVVRDKIPQKIKNLHINCNGFNRAIDTSSKTCGEFLGVVNRRNDRLHGNFDPVRDAVETVYFEGTRPLFQQNGNHIQKLFEHLEAINSPEQTLQDYIAVQNFISDVLLPLDRTHRKFVELMMSDPYPGYEVKDKRVNRILPPHSVGMLFPGERFDDELDVKWNVLDKSGS